MAILKHIFQPLKVGSMTIKNRVLMSGMAMNFGLDDMGYVTPQLIEYYIERGRNRPGMMILASGIVHFEGSVSPSFYRYPNVFEDKALPGLERLVKAVNKYDVKFGVQLTHYGVWHDPVLIVSLVPELAGFGLLPPVPPGREMSKKDIKECVKAFADAADRCVRAGFDFLEIEAAHPPALISSFLSPYYNRRTDEYGGSFENRIRFLLEVIRAVRHKVGRKVPVGMRTMGDEFIGRQGWTSKDLCQLAPIVEQEGIDYFSLAFGNEYQTPQFIIPSIYEKQGTFIYASDELKKYVSAPVAAVGRIKNPVMADEIIRDGKADIIVMGRAHIADPEIVEKARRGLLADIRPCIADCLGCAHQVLNLQPASCTVNPRVGREYLIKEVKGEKGRTARRVLVAGAGPAGLEAARRAAFSGHKVILCEAKGCIGGQLRLASLMPERQEMGDIIPWYERQLNRLHVEIRLNTKVDRKLLNAIKPDVLVVATGSLPLVPEGFIDGLENIKKIEPMMIDELLEDKKPTGDVVLIIGGWDHMGVQLADYLSQLGKRVYLADRGPSFGQKMTLLDWPGIEERLKKAGVSKYLSVERLLIDASENISLSTPEGKHKLPKIDTIVFAGNRRPNRFLEEAGKKIGTEVHIIGDAHGVEKQDEGTVLAAIAAGYDIGRLI